MNPSNKKLYYALYLLALLSIVAFVWRAAHRRGPTLTFSKIDVDLLNDRSARRAVEARQWPLVPETPKEWREYITKDEANVLLPSLATSTLSFYDEWMYMIGPAKRRDGMAWAEHPNNYVTAESNSDRLRGTLELAKELPDLRVLVAGDSHTYGVCTTPETFSGLLLSSLSQRNSDKTVEVLNAGYGGYTFYNYVGTLLRWRVRSPQVIVVCIFAGNDFAEALPFMHFFANEELPHWTDRQLAFVNRAFKLGPDAMGQGLYSAYVFHCRPTEADRSIEAGIAAMKEIRAIGEKIGTSMVVCFLPNAPLQKFDPPIEQVEITLKVLRADGFDMAPQTNMEDHFVQRLYSEGFECVDMRPIFATEPNPPFWRADLHLSVRGHELVAKALEPILRRLLER